MIVRIITSVLTVFIITAIAVSLWGYNTLKSSLPVLDGSVSLPKLTNEVIVERDFQGVPKVIGKNRQDVTRALGFIHAQERFFQMDLQRRSAAGELSELFGKVALDRDKNIRKHRFRLRASKIFASIPTFDRTILKAYADGVNEGLSALAKNPFEYIVLGVDPKPWTIEDTMLTLFTMYIALQDEDGLREYNRYVMHQALPREVYEFLTPKGTLQWDAPIEGNAIAEVAIPNANIFDLRKQSALANVTLMPLDPDRVEMMNGSNNWLMSGKFTQHGSALVADDMHLRLALPHIWYKAMLQYTSDNGQPVSMVGVSLPGTPTIIVGSNTHIAWGFTNSQGDWNDLVQLELLPSDPSLYMTPQGPKKINRTNEIIKIKDDDDFNLLIEETIWGPIVNEDPLGNQFSLRWSAHDINAGNLGLTRLETATNIEQALDIANNAGVVAQNFVVGDSQGNIAWTIIGPIPNRIGYDGYLPTSWADGKNQWDGYLNASDYPRVINPESGRIWTANSRVVSGEKLQKIGYGGYALGARAQQIRDDLLVLDKANELDMLKIQLDDRAIFLTRWKTLLMSVLNTMSENDMADLKKFKQYVQDWGARASVDSIGYRLVRRFRLETQSLALAPFQTLGEKFDTRFDILQTTRFVEGPVWQLVTQKPEHLLNPRFSSWDSLLAEAVKNVVQDYTNTTGNLDDYTWGNYNTLKMQHPFSRIIGAVSGYLDMPDTELPGDGYLPLAQRGNHGPSQRMAVSPGHEENGIMQTPGGQAGHPMSPYYGLGHDQWVSGTPTPLLPGEAVYTLRFVPTSK